jgi:hypothetical protein
MKVFFVTLGIFITVLLVWLVIGMKRIDRNVFLPSTVLDKAIPLDVIIDIEFIKNLKNPANGTNR